MIDDIAAIVEDNESITTENESLAAGSRRVPILVLMFQKVLPRLPATDGHTKD